MNESQRNEDLYNQWTAASEKVAKSAGDPLARLSQLEEMRHYIEATERLYVIRARAAGASWSAIGAQFAMSKQAAQQKFGAL